MTCKTKKQVTQICQLLGTLLLTHGTDCVDARTRHASRPQALGHDCRGDLCAGLPGARSPALSYTALNCTAASHFLSALIRAVPTAALGRPLSALSELPGTWPVIFYT